MSSPQAAPSASAPASDISGDFSEEVKRRALELATLFAVLTGIDVMALSTGLETPLRGLEIDSLVFIAFLGRTEKQYGFEWDEDTPPEVFETLLTVARCMLCEVAGVQAERGGSAR